VELRSLLLVFIAAFFAIPAVLSLTIGRIIERQSGALAVAVCGLLTPVLLLIAATVQYYYSAPPDPHEDYVLFPYILPILAFTAVPGLLTSAITLLLAKP
jgi:hypothetical protein